MRIDWLGEFADPPASVGHQMFWIWNGEVTEGRITEMLEQFAERGVGGVLVHPRPGMITEYLSARFWELWDYSLEECIRLGLECHIYDEDSFPSGSAGGLTLEACPEAAQQIIRAARHDAAPAKLDGELLAAFRLDSEGCIAGQLAADASLDEAVGEGPILTFALAAPGRRRGYPDLTLPEATQTFLRLTHDQYARHFADHFGREIKYVFTDEPGIACRDGLIASDYLLSEFEREHGYRLPDRLEAFMADDADGRAVRFDYFRAVNRLWLANWCKASYDWCEAHGLAFTGHYNEHEWPRPETVPDAMAAQRWMQAPGIDLLGFQFDPSERLKNSFWLLTMKEVASVANQLGAGRVFCEAYGAKGYDMAMPEFKPLSDWLLACGVNVINPHLSHESLAGARKYEWPQTLSDHASWWPCYGIQARHDARLTCAVSRGRERNRVLLLHPTLTGWLHYLPRSFRQSDEQARCDARLERLKDSQSTIVQALSDNQIDFDLGDELIMAEIGAAEGRTLRVGEASYDVVVLPEGMETWLGTTVDLVAEFLRGGGTLLALGAPPSLLDGRPSDRAAVLAREHPGRWVCCRSADEVVGRLREIVPPRVSRPDGSPLPPDVTYYRRETADGQAVHLFVNPWQGEAHTPVRLEGGSLMALDTMTGRCEAVPTRQHGGGQVFDLHLYPSGHALFVSGPAREEVAARAPLRATPVEVGPVSAERLEPNILVLDYCDVEADGLEERAAAEQGVNVTRANRLAWQAMGFERDPWHGVQFKRTWIDREFPAETAVSVAYRFTVERGASRVLRDSLKIAVERPWLYSVELNGQPLDFAEAERWWDEEVRRLSVREAVRPGENVLRMTARPFHVLCEIAPVYVLGEFALRKSSPGFVITEPQALGLGDWLDQGLCFYPWAVRYRAAAMLRGPAEALTVRLPEWAGSAARVLLDGREAGVIAYPPHELQIEEHLTAGRHELAIDVFGNMKNMMGPPFSDGLPGIWTWEVHPEHTPDGDAYRLFTCGMMRPPQVTALCS